MELTEQELKVIDLLAMAHNEHCKLEIVHPNDRAEFVDAIHKAQNIVMARLAAKTHPHLFLNIHNANS